MGKFLRGPRRRLFAVAGVMGAITAVAVGIAVSVGGASSDPSVEIGATANAISTRAAVPVHTVDLGSLPQVAEGVASNNPAMLKDLSPLGAAALEQAKANADALAPLSSQVISSQPAGATPGGATFGWNGLADSATICSYFGSGCQPSDQGLASDGVNTVQTVNTSIAVYDAKTGAIKAGFPKSLQAFAGVPAPSPAGCDSAHGNQPFLSDPRAFYDPVRKRFWVAFLQVENAFGIAPSCTFLSRYWVAVSSTSDPTGAWHVYAFNTANLVGSPNNAADYTQFGFNSEAVFIGGNQFNQGGTAFNGAWTLAIPKKTAENGGAIGSISGFGGYTANDGTATRLLDTVQPVASYGAPNAGPAGEILISSFNESITESKVVVFDFSNALSGQGHGQTLSGVVVNTLAYAQPPLADNFPSCTNCLETIDTRISATPVYMGGNAYFTHDTALNNNQFVNANVLYGVIHPVLSQTSVAGCTLCSTITGATSVVDQNYIVYNGQTDTWFGAIQPDRENNLFIGYDYGSTTGSTSPSTVYIAKRATASGFPDGGFFLKVGPNATFDSRWGDYSAIAFEGWTLNTILFASQVPAPSGDWATHIDRVKYANLTQQ